MSRSRENSVTRYTLRDLEKLAEELVESIDEEPEMEPGHADTTPAVPRKDDS